MKGFRVKEGRTNKRETHVSLEKSREKEGLRLKPQLGDRLEQKKKKKREKREKAKKEEEDKERRRTGPLARVLPFLFLILSFVFSKYSGRREEERKRRR